MSRAGSSSALKAFGLASFEVTSSGSPCRYKSTRCDSSSRPLASNHASPTSSYLGRPALPIICKTSRTGRGMVMPAAVLHRL